jgi:hypothetical protein
MDLYVRPPWFETAIHEFEAWESIFALKTRKPNEPSAAS